MLPFLSCLFCLTACVYVNQTQRGPESHALPPQPDTRLGTLLSTADDFGRALVISDPELALTSRLDLIDAAERSVDVQYFIWQNDPSGILVIDRLLAAADRGVRVRALVDDVQLEGLVSKINAITRHPNVEVRIFNPFSVRFGMQLRLFRLAEFAIDGNRLNHRMHNKLLVADNHAAIMGGRNIGDDYFGLSRKRNFVDTDLLLSGPIVPQLSAGFDTYWNSGWAVPSDDLHSKYILFDDETVFLGSLNLDPRSLYLNTELGVILRSSTLVDELKTEFGRLRSRDNAWQVVAHDRGFEWHSAVGTVRRQPAKSAWQRFRSWLMMFLPLSAQI